MQYSFDKNLIDIRLIMKSSLIFTVAFLIGVTSSFSDFGVVSTHAQLGQFPNELTGYEFFQKGKLESVEFGVSGSQNIEQLFGDTCEKGCYLDERFTIKFDYLSCDDCMTTEHIRDRAMCPLNEYMGTIEKITISPRVPVQFDRVSTYRFPKRTGGGISFRDGSGGVSWESFGDEFGLKYSIKQSATSSLKLTTPPPAFMDGQLYSIEYGLSSDLETRIFKAEYKNCMKQTQVN